MKRVFDIDDATVKKLTQVIRAGGNATAIADANVKRSLSSTQRRQLDLLVDADTKEESKERDPDKKEAMKDASGEVKESVGTFSDFLLHEAELAEAKVTLDTESKSFKQDAAMAARMDPKMLMRKQILAAREQLKTEKDPKRKQEIKLSIQRMSDDMSNSDNNSA